MERHSFSSIKGCPSFSGRACSFGSLASAAMLLGAGKSVSATGLERCYDACVNAATETGVPIEVLIALTWTETGCKIDGRMRPWPWAVNSGDSSHWFPNRQASVAFAALTLHNGNNNLDIGCFQLNYPWHVANFASVEAMFDPDQNAFYAAQLIEALHQESNDWSVAAGSYHSRTQALATRYRAIFDRNLFAARSAADLVWNRLGRATNPERRRSLLGNLLLGFRVGPVLLGSLAPLQKEG